MVVLAKSHTVQCTIVGDGMVGKTTLAQTFAGKPVSGKYVATVLDNYRGKTFVAGDQYDVRVTDAAGQHEYEDIRLSSYETTEVFIVCYSVVDRDSFDSIKTFWVPETKKTGPKRPIFLVATQTDLVHVETDHVDEKEGKHLAKEIHADGYFEVCSTSKDVIKKLFASATMSCLKQRKHKSNIVKHLFGR